MLNRILIIIISLVLCHQTLAFEGFQQSTPKGVQTFKKDYVSKFTEKWHKDLKAHISFYNQNRNKPETFLPFVRDEEKEAAKNEIRKAKISNLVLPKIENKKDKYYTRFDRTLISFSALDIYKQQFRVNGKVIKLLEGKSFYENLEHLSSELKKVQSFSLMNFLIPEAHAVALFLGLFMLALVFLTNLIYQVVTRIGEDGEEKLVPDLSDAVKKSKQNVVQCEKDLESLKDGRDYYLKPPGLFITFNRIKEIEKEMNKALLNELNSSTSEICRNSYLKTIAKTNNVKKEKVDDTHIKHLCREQRRERNCLENFYAFHKGHIKTSMNRYDQKTGTYHPLQIEEAQKHRVKGL